MKTYTIKAGTRGLTFGLTDGKLTPGTCSFTEDQILMENDVIDTPVHEQLGIFIRRDRSINNLRQRSDFLLGEFDNGITTIFCEAFFWRDG